MNQLIKRFLSLGFVLMLCSTVANVAAADEKRIELIVPGAPWALTLPAGDFVVQQQQLKPDGQAGYFYLIDEKRLLGVSMFIEPVKDCRDSKSCRDMIWKAGNPSWVNLQNIVQSEIEGVSFVEFLIPEFQGKAIRQQNIYAEFVRDGYWVDLHISKALYQPDDHKLFEQVIKSVNFEPKTNQQKPSSLAANAPDDRPQNVDREQVRKFEVAIKPYVEKARNTYPEARKRYLAGLPPKNVFSVTARLYDAAGRFEQVFIEVKEIKDGIIKGVIISDVQLVTKYKYGDAYSFPEAELIDWTISKPDGTEEGNFVGNFLDTYKPN